MSEVTSEGAANGAVLAEAVREPRVDPRPGDELSKGKVSRYVTFVSVGGQTHREGLVVYETGQRSSQKKCDLRTWRRWAKKAGVAHIGKPPIDVCLSVHVPHHVQQQITGLANRFINNGGLSTSTPFDETVEALLELGLVHVLGAYGERQLEAILKAKFQKKGPVS